MHTCVSGVKCFRNRQREGEGEGGGHDRTSRVHIMCRRLCELLNVVSCHHFDSCLSPGGGGGRGGKREEAFIV